MAEDEPVIYGIKSQSATDTWRDKILERLLRPEEVQRLAYRLREQLLLDSSIAETHLEFINNIASKFVCSKKTLTNSNTGMLNFLRQNGHCIASNFFSEEASVKLRIEIRYDPDFVIPQEHLETALKFGIEKTDGSDINKYAVTFIKKLLLQRVKVDQNMLESYLSPAVLKQWQEMLCRLEERNRKLINIQNGSLIFVLYCPTRKSRRQLYDENWRTEIQERMAKLLKLLGNQNSNCVSMRNKKECLLSKTKRKRYQVNFT